MRRRERKQGNTPATATTAWTITVNSQKRTKSGSNTSRAIHTVEKKLGTFLLVIIAAALLGTIVFFYDRQQTQAVLNRAPVPYAQDLDEWQRVTVTGTYSPLDDVLIATRPGYHVVTPFRSDAGPVILVNRGTPQNGRDYAPAPSGKVTITGYIRRTQPGMSAVAEKYPPETDRIDTQGLALALNQTFELDYLQLAEGQPGVLDPAPMPG
ncbi:SURF1 family protein [Corynebacterium canis]|uniref:SURF1-like protein n=1 Tax=Corynebacterium canis TaxID=679663 RepID=A0A5C5UQ00_9CORY|nr:SURF1 family protein [Corynebacterium canis]